MGPGEKPDSPLVLDASMTLKIPLNAALMSNQICGMIEIVLMPWSIKDA